MNRLFGKSTPAKVCTESSKTKTCILATVSSEKHIREIHGNKRIIIRKELNINDSIMMLYHSKPENMKSTITRETQRGGFFAERTFGKRKATVPGPCKQKFA
jgi:hypothetical protein